MPTIVGAALGRAARIAVDWLRSGSTGSTGGTGSTGSTGGTSLVKREARDI
jgi:hypothetical protein